MSSSKFFNAITTTGSTVYLIIRQVDQNLIYDITSNQFVSEGLETSAIIPVTEDSVAKGSYWVNVNGSNIPWPDGTYISSMYKAVGSPDPASDTIIANNSFAVATNMIIG